MCYYGTIVPINILKHKPVLYAARRIEHGITCRLNRRARPQKLNASFIDRALFSYITNSFCLAITQRGGGLCVFSRPV